MRGKRHLWDGFIGSWLGKEGRRYSGQVVIRKQDHKIIRLGDCDAS